MTDLPRNPLDAMLPSGKTARENMAELNPEPQPLDPEAEWLMLRVEAVKKKGKHKTFWAQHGIGRTEAEALQTISFPEGYKCLKTEVVERNIRPEDYGLFRLPMFDAIREERSKAAKR